MLCHRHDGQPLTYRRYGGIGPLTLGVAFNGKGTYQNLKRRCVMTSITATNARQDFFEIVKDAT